MPLALGNAVLPDALRIVLTYEKVKKLTHAYNWQMNTITAEDGLCTHWSEFTLYKGNMVQYLQIINTIYQFEPGLVSGKREKSCVLMLNRNIIALLYIVYICRSLAFFKNNNCYICYTSGISSKIPFKLCMLDGGSF
jgi:hypothetical protein